MSDDYGVLLICEGGHVIGDHFASSQAAMQHAKRCPTCGKPTHSECPECKTPLRGQMRGVVARTKNVDPHCHNCGAAIPWYKEPPHTPAGASR